MRVLHVMECTIGGTRRHLVDVARGQKRRGMDVHVVASTLRDPDFPADLDALEAEGVLVTRLDMLREVTPSVDRAHLGQIMQILREVRPDIVHTHSSKAGVLGRQASQTTGIGRRVHSPHTFAFLFKALFSWPKRLAYQAVEGHFSYRSQAIIAVSESEAASFRGTWAVPSKRIRVVPNGIDPAPFAGAEAYDLSELGLDPSRPTALMVGLVYAAKGQDLALEALAQPGMEELQLVCAGPGDLTEVEAQVQRLGLADRVRFLGARRDVPELLAACDFLALSSRWEGMPYVVLEAMAAGKPVLATPVNGAVDAIADPATGILCEAIDADSVAAGMRRMLAAGAGGRALMGAEAAAALEGRFTIPAMLDGLQAVYEELL